MEHPLIVIAQLVLITTSALKIDFGGKHYHVLPGDINPNVTELDLLYNDFRRIENHTFDGLFLLEILVLDWNGVKYISPKAFWNNPVLWKIDLYEHRLLVIPENFGEAADSLVELGMKVRSKHVLQTVNFTDYPLLEGISFTHGTPANGIITLKNLPSLKWLYAEHCGLISFPNLSETPNLETTNLHTGFYTSIPKEYLASSTKLWALRLPDGQLTHLPAMNNMVSLSYLEIENNNLTTLPDLYHLPLREIKMQHNPWVCDQALCWVRMWPFMKEFSLVIDSMNTNCSSPTEAAGTPLMERHPVTMRCYNGKLENIIFFHNMHTAL